MDLKLSGSMWMGMLRESDGGDGVSCDMATEGRRDLFAVLIVIGVFRQRYIAEEDDGNFSIKKA
jgi:hypothetical protein